jgi:putative two-component system response regulator
MSKSVVMPVIMSVDDDPVVLNEIMSTLGRDNIVRPFTSAEAALKFIKDNSVDLILLDHNMPMITGFDMLRVLKEDEKYAPIPVIFLTGTSDEEGEIRALTMGAIDYLKKPFHPKALITRVHLQLELFRYRNHLESLVAEKTAEITRINQALVQRDRVTLNLLARASDMRDHDVGEHIARTTGYARIMVDDILERPCDGYRLTDERGGDIVDATKLHDIGKIAMPDKILAKPGPLTREEFEIIKMHPVYGENMLRAAVRELGEGDSMLQCALHIAYGHHEKWDGTGYPRGLAGEKIPLEARIAAMADVFDALTSRRPYKPPYQPRRAFDIMYQSSGTHFDPKLIEIMNRHEEAFSKLAASNADSSKAADQFNPYTAY